MSPAFVDELRRKSEVIETAIRSQSKSAALNDPLPLDLSDKIKVPEGAIQDPVIGQELTFSEETSEELWLTAILNNQSVAEFGCDVGRRAAYLSQVASRIVCTDTEAKRRTFAEQTMSINRVNNAVVVDDVSVDEMSKFDVLIFNSRRPISPKHIAAISSRPTPLIVVLGPLSKELARDILGAGYSHCAEFPRGAVFCAQSA